MTTSEKIAALEIIDEYKTMAYSKFAPKGKHCVTGEVIDPNLSLKSFIRKLEEIENEIRKGYAN